MLVLPIWRVWVLVNARFADPLTSRFLVSNVAKEPPLSIMTTLLFLPFKTV